MLVNRMAKVAGFVVSWVIMSSLVISMQNHYIVSLIEMLVVVDVVIP